MTLSSSSSRGMSRDNWRWCWVYVAASCCANIGQGLVTTVVGPTQLYLARNVDVDIDTINLVSKITISLIAITICRHKPTA